MALRRHRGVASFALSLGLHLGAAALVVRLSIAVVKSPPLIVELVAAPKPPPPPPGSPGGAPAGGHPDEMPGVPRPPSRVASAPAPAPERPSTRPPPTQPPPPITIIPEGKLAEAPISAPVTAAPVPAPEKGPPPHPDIPVLDAHGEVHDDDLPPPPKEALREALARAEEAIAKARDGHPADLTGAADALKQAETLARDLAKDDAADGPVGGGTAGGGAAGLGAGASLDGLVAARVAWAAGMVVGPSHRKASRAGRALIWFEVNARGYVTRWQLVRSCGVRAFDREVQSILHLAEPFPANAHAFDVELPFGPSSVPGL